MIMSMFDGIFGAGLGAVMCFLSIIVALVGLVLYGISRLHKAEDIDSVMTTGGRYGIEYAAKSADGKKFQVSIWSTCHVTKETARLYLRVWGDNNFRYVDLANNRMASLLTEYFHATAIDQILEDFANIKAKVMNEVRAEFLTKGIVIEFASVEIEYEPETPEVTEKERLEQQIVTLEETKALIAKKNQLLAEIKVNSIKAQGLSEIALAEVLKDVDAVMIEVVVNRIKQIRQAEEESLAETEGKEESGIS